MSRLVLFAFAAVVFAVAASVARADGGHSVSLSAAVLDGDLPRVRHLVTTHSANLEEPGALGRTPLHRAADIGHAGIVRFLGESGANIHATTDNLWTPLHHAAGGGHLESAKILVSLGADPDAGGRVQGVSGWTPLHLAARNGHLPVVRHLVDAGADINAGTANGTPLNLADTAANNSAAIVAFLIERGGHRSDGSPAHASIYDAIQNDDLETLRHLVEEHGADVNRYNRDNNYIWRPLHYAGRYGKLDAARYLASKGATPYHWDRFSSSPLHVSARGGHPDLVRFFIVGIGMDPDYNRVGTVNEGNTPLALAAQYGHPEAARALLDLGADPNIVWDSLDSTPLDFAVNAGHAEVARVLISGGAQFAGGCPEGRVPDPDGDRVACVCAPGSADHDNDPDAGECLAGAHPHDSMLAAAASGSVTIVAHLATVHSQDVNQKDESGWTPLHWAAFGGHLTIVRFLIDEGATVNAESANGDAPLDVAAGRGHSEVVRFLADNGGVPDIVVRVDSGDQRNTVGGAGGRFGSSGRGVGSAGDDRHIRRRSGRRVLCVGLDGLRASDIGHRESFGRRRKRMRRRGGVRLAGGRGFRRH